MNACASPAREARPTRISPVDGTRCALRVEVRRVRAPGLAVIGRRSDLKVKLAFRFNVAVSRGNSRLLAAMAPFAACRRALLPHSTTGMLMKRATTSPFVALVLLCFVALFVKGLGSEVPKGGAESIRVTSPGC